VFTYNTSLSLFAAARAGDDELMQEELKNVLTLFREKRKIEIQKTPEVYINQHSSVDEVQEWLGAKGFSDRIRKQLNNLDGSELFKLKKAQLEAYCGKEEGRRLDSQITISRNTTGVSVNPKIQTTPTHSPLTFFFYSTKQRVPQS
jgi:hypothetical protein